MSGNRMSGFGNAGSWFSFRLRTWLREGHSRVRKPRSRTPPRSVRPAEAPRCARSVQVLDIHATVHDV
eukprot:6544410-Pyramimonas_sp.AAC.1